MTTAAPTPNTPSNWSSYGTGVSGTVFALAASPTHTFFGGRFTVPGMSNLVRWDGFSMLPVGISPDNDVLALWYSADINTLFISGIFSNVGGVAAQYIAKWNGTWYAFPAGMISTGRSLYYDDDTQYLYVGTGLAIQRFNMLTSQWTTLATITSGFNLNAIVYDTIVDCYYFGGGL